MGLSISVLLAQHHHVTAVDIIADKVALITQRKSPIVLLGTWLSCMKLKLETKGFVNDIEIDGGAVMNSLIVTYMWVQMGFPTGVCGVRSQMLT